jgi:glycosyltransferase involved in cell wall biosynthesis
MLVRLLEASGAPERFHVVSLGDDGYYGARLRAQGIAVTSLRIRGILTALLALPRLVRLMRRLRPDVVQTFMYHANFFGGVAARLSGVPGLVWGIRQTSLDARHNKARTLWVARAGAWLSARLPDRIVACSQQSAAAHLAFGYDARPMLVLPNGFDIVGFSPRAQARQAFRLEAGINHGESVIGMVARYDPVKDHQGLLAAFAKVSADRPDCRLVLCGQGVEAGNDLLQREIGKLALEGRVMLLGPRPDVARIMNAIDVHVLASSSEGFPNVLGEAMACGTPCVATDVGDSREIVGDTGWLVPPRDPAALARAMLEAIGETAEQRVVRAARCRQRIAEHFEIGAVSNRYEALWRDLAASGHGA